MEIERWMLETREAGITVSRAFFSTKEQAEREAQKRRDEHVGFVRAYVIKHQKFTI